MLTKINLQKIKSFTISIVTIIIFVVLFSKINIYQFAEHLKEANLFFLLLGVGIFIFTELFISSVQWVEILRQLNCHISLKEAMFIRIGSIPAKSMLPFRSGELLRAFYLKKQKQFPVSLGVGSLLFQLIINLLVLISIMSSAYIYFFKLDNIIFFSLILAFLFIFCILSFKFINKFILYLAKKVNFQFYESLKALFNIHRNFKLKSLVVILFYSVIMWVGELFIFIFIFKTVGLDIPLYAILIFVPWTIIISNIPITISGLGTREASIVLLFLQFGSPEKLLSSGVLMSFIQFVLPLTFSLLFLRKFLKKIMV
ncbi:MAG: flippase-like domain-containing protein [Candidatus Omnitrophica bacterium]|nr:flippase-like domain-containing protein [Candidatus Omnitrophota bacterium]